MEHQFLNGCIRLLSGKETLISALEAKLATEFEKKLFEAAINNLLDAYNPLRFNNFAYATRELVRHILSRLAPKDEVLACEWYRNETETEGGISRRQRIVFAIRGGLTDNYVANTLQIDTVPTTKEIIGVVNNLSKHTHIEEITIDIDIEKQDEYVTETLESVSKLFEVVERSRQAISESLIDHIGQEVMRAAISTTIIEIDELATHHTIEEVLVEEVHVKSIDSNHITFTVYGTISVDLLYGSEADREKGNGATMYSSFPFSCILQSSVVVPDVFHSEDTDLQVNTDEWYK
jgi:hypothetical protein